MPAVLSSSPPLSSSSASKRNRSAGGRSSSSSKHAPSELIANGSPSTTFGFESATAQRITSGGFPPAIREMGVGVLVGSSGGGRSPHGRSAKKTDAAETPSAPARTSRRRYQGGEGRTGSAPRKSLARASAIASAEQYLLPWSFSRQV